MTLQTFWIIGVMTFNSSIGTLIGMAINKMNLPKFLAYVVPVLFIIGMSIMLDVVFITVLAPTP